VLTSKLRIRIGDVEIDCEGSEEFLKEELPVLLKTTMELHNAAGGSAAPKNEANKGGSSGAKGTVGSMTTGSIAAKLGAKTGPELLRAAAARLTLVSKMETFSRQQLLDEMKSAPGYYKSSYSGNLSQSFKGALASNILTEVATDTFALTAPARAELENKLVNS